MSVNNIFIRLALLIIVLLPINFYIVEELLNLDFDGLYYFMYAYFILLVSIVHLVLKKSLRERPQKFVVSFMGAMGIKIFVSLGLLVVIMYTGINNSKEFALNYVTLYMLFNAFSIKHLLRAQRSETGKAKKPN